MVFLGGGHPMNNGFTMISLKPRSERTASADQIIRRLRKEIARVPGATLFLQSAQDVNVGGRTSRTQYQYTLQDADLGELSEWAPRMLTAMKKLPQLIGGHVRQLRQLLHGSQHPGRPLAQFPEIGILH